MQLSLRTQLPKSNLPPAVSSKNYMLPAEAEHVPAKTFSRSLTTKLSRKFTVKKSSRSSASSDSDSHSSTSTSSYCTTPVPSKSGYLSMNHLSNSNDSSPVPSRPASPSHSREASAHDGGPLRPVKSGYSDESAHSSSSAYDYGYGSGCYAVNLEHMYPRKQQNLVLPLDVLAGTGEFYDVAPEEQDFITRGLKKFSVQDYLAVL